MMFKYAAIFLLTVCIVSCESSHTHDQMPKQVSGIYPHLAYYNSEDECGTGAVVPWADRLWVVTYGPHFPFGSSDKLYEITPGLQQIIRPESIGGTPANRMIHLESNQLFIGPYAIDRNRSVRVIPYTEMPGRLTGNARHLTDPAGKIYYGTMEEGFYEVDVRSLKVNTIYPDGNTFRTEEATGQYGPLLPGSHGKGLYSGQGVLVYSNNGEDSPEALTHFDIEAGALCEWDGKDWKVIRRNQFVEVTGPGDIYGNKNPESDPIWATGWDYKSVILGVRDPGSGWFFYRLPIASHSYDGAHGWNTEWPRIRNIGTEDDPDFLMTMHGLFWKFPGSFTHDNSAGIRPRSAYLKVIGDFTRWNDRLVFGCDDSAKREFMNKRKQKGNIEGPGQSNSNLWFTSLNKPDQLGPATVSGAVWLNEKVRSGEYCEPFLFGGWKNRCAWIQSASNHPVSFHFEVDKTGSGKWEFLETVELASNSDRMFEFPEKDRGEWIRVKPDKDVLTTISFNYSRIESREENPSQIFDGLAVADNTISLGGLLYGLGNERRSLGVSAVKFTEDRKEEIGYYELDEHLDLTPKTDKETLAFIQEKFAIPQNVVEIDGSSVLIVDDRGRRWRLPLGNDAFTDLTNAACLRICREVATERDLFNCHGTFYELPAENADGFAKIRPVSSHNFRIHDYASYRGMLVMTGIDPDAVAGENIIRSDDCQAAVWVGVIDDLWELGKPTGIGGPWKDTEVQKDIPSDPYLIGFYNHRSLRISHDSESQVAIRIEVEPVGHGPWMLYKKLELEQGETFTHDFPESFQARWIRFIADQNCKATAWLEYK